MTKTSITGPAAEPLTLAEAKAHLRVITGDEDAFIARLITAARQHIENQTGLCLISQQVRHSLDVWPRTRDVLLPAYPVLSIDVVRTYGDDETFAVLDPAHIYLAAASRPARMVLRAGRLWPQPALAVGGIEIDFTAGFGPGAEDVPAPLRQAAAQLVAHWFENREPVTSSETPLPVPQMTAALLAPYRRVGLA